MNLFQSGDFPLHSGSRSSFKIDVDALSDDEITTLAEQFARRLPSFCEVEGVPRGGLRLAAALQPYATHKDHCHPLLIVDDVYTTGASMQTHRAGRDAIGAVLFSRKPIDVKKHYWIYALFTMMRDCED